MPEKDRIYLFHIFRKDGSFLFLDPFGSPDKFVGALERSEVEGRYGMEPRVEALTMFRNELYRNIEAGVKNWLSDARFVPKFLISALVFVVFYFFMSFVVRDPLPVIDEIAIGLVAAVVVFFVQGRRDMNSKAATKKRLDLRVIVDRITFKESAFVRQVEEALHRNETGSIEEVIKQIVEPARQELEPEVREEAAQFIRALEHRFNFKKLQREERLLKRVMGRSPGELNKSFARLVESKKYDFPLYAVYKSYKKTVANKK
ncbi:MAG: hypothetical protein JSV89_06005 [Spirochaetaceae bacterium]|nr:MAG: hypothetical protein JSV89_06005 [Spirochaetaceae bacterium]